VGHIAVTDICQTDGAEHARCPV